MGIYINVEVTAVSRCGTVSTAADINKKSSSTVMNSGADFREALEVFSKQVLGEDCQIYSKSSKDFEYSFLYWKKGEKEELWECPQGSEEAVNRDGDNKLDWYDLNESYQPSWWTPLPEVSGEEIKITFYSYQNSDSVTVKGITEEVTIKAALAAIPNIQFIKVGSTVVDSYGNRIELSTLSAEEQEKFGVRFPSTTESI